MKEVGKLIITIIAVVVSYSHTYAQKLDYTAIFSANVEKEILGNKTLYDSNKDKNKYNNAHMMIIDGILVLMFEQGIGEFVPIDSANRIFFNISNLCHEWINPQKQDGVRFQGYASCKQINMENGTFKLELLPNGKISIRIGENWKLCNNIQNFNMTKLFELSRFKGSSYNSNCSPITFRPKNATVVDSEGSHNFSSFDCPNMTVTDKGNSVDVSWGGDKVVLYRSTNNNDTYTATGYTSRGNLTIKAFRSSASGKIYLVTTTMPNPSSDVKRITINFKP